MIAARYGFGHGQTLGVDGTFTYTNAVPQIGSFNRGSWCQAEKRVIDLAKKCHQKAITNKQNARVYVVVGVIPTSFFGQPRFFGSGGTVRFSNFQNDKYKLLLPEIMWTAVCCIHTDGTIYDRKAFYGSNSETNHEMKEYVSARTMFQAMKTKWSTLKFPTITVFPGKSGCN
jgi:DNA/RNA endonuclease G (NUC1)